MSDIFSPDGEFISRDLEHVSHSQLLRWIRCPKQWEYRYVYGLPEVVSGALIEGGCYHEGIELNYKQKISSHMDLPVPDILDAYSTSWEERVQAEEIVEWGDKSESTYKDEGLRLLITYMNTVAPFYQPVLIEHKYEGIHAIEGVEFVCTPDMVDTNRVIIDHKTSAKPYVQSDVDIDIQLSAESYATGIFGEAQFHVAVKSKNPHIQIIKTHRTELDVAWWYTMASGIVKQMKTGAAPPKPIDAFGKRGYWCSSRWCAYYQRCQEGLTRTISTP